VYFVHRDFPLTDIHPGALLAAHVANCAASQDSFWPMHDLLFAGQAAGEWGSGGEADIKTFLGYAQELRLDTAALERCVTDNRYSSQIEADFQDALQHGVRSTPSFLINGKLLVGMHPYATWQEIFDEILSAP
jgi:protein-disulfide isomerase